MKKIVLAFLATFLLVLPAYAGGKGGYGGKGGGGNYSKSYSKSYSRSNSRSRATAYGGSVTIKGGGFGEALGGGLGQGIGNSIGCAIAGGCGGGGDGGVVVKTNVNVTINNNMATPGYQGVPSKDDVVTTGPIGAPTKRNRKRCPDGTSYTPGCYIPE